MKIWVILICLLINGIINGAILLTVLYVFRIKPEIKKKEPDELPAEAYHVESL